jgi:hypothetical protein
MPMDVKITTTPKGIISIQLPKKMRFVYLLGSSNLLWRLLQNCNNQRTKLTLDNIDLWKQMTIVKRCKNNNVLQMGVVELFQK